MRIGIDIKHLRKNSAGIKVYLENMLNSLQNLDSENTYCLFSPSSVAYKIFNKNFSIINTNSRLPGILWQQYELPRHIKFYNLDVFWGPEQTIFLKKEVGVKKVLTVHDFAYKRFPKTMKGTVRTITKHYGARSISNSDALVCVSEFTARELKNFYPKVDDKKIWQINNGIAPVFEMPKNSKENFLLFAGSLEPRKNLQSLLKALELLGQKGIHIKLKIVGPAGWKNKAFKEMLQNSSIQNMVEILGFVSKEELNRLYSSCLAFVFPSLYEGFGLPALEALNAFARVLTSKNSPMEEFLGPLGFYFDPKSPDSIAETLEKVLRNRDCVYYTSQEQLLREKILRNYSWENSAKKMLELFKVLHG